MKRSRFPIPVRQLLRVGLCGAGLFHAQLAFADPAYAVSVDAPPAKKAQKAVAKIHIAPASGFHMNKDYPTAVSIVGPAGVTLEKPKQSAKDATKFEEGGADFEVAFTSTEVGKKVFTGEVKFAVCSQNSCDPKKEKLSFSVEVK